MTRNLLIAATLVTLAACSQQEPAPATSAAVNATPATTTPVAAAQTQDQNCPAQSGYQILPTNIILTFPYHLRADRIHTNKNGQERRNVVLEFLDGDVESTLKAVDSAMTAAGYVARPRQELPNGNSVVPYVLKGFGMVSVMASPKAGDKPSNPAAKGIVAFDYSHGPAKAAKATAAQ